MSLDTASPASKTRPILTLVAVCVAGGLLPMSLTGSSVALPGINADLDPAFAQLQWVVNGYNLAFASLMLAAGSLADRVGRRRIFTIGSLLFALASLVSGLAGNVLVLDAARVVAGVGAAAVLTSGSAMLAQTFQGPAMARAFGALGTSFGIGIAFGPFIGGMLVEVGGWRTVFLAHAALSGLVLLATRLMTESHAKVPGRVDWSGTITFTSSLFLFVLAVVEGPQLGWLGPINLMCYAGSAVLLAAFVVVERRQANPMFDLSLFLQSRYVAVCLVPVALAFGFVTLLVLLPSYFMSIDGATAQQAGITMLFLTTPTLVMPTVAGYVSKWVSVRALLVVTLVLVAVGAAWLTVLEPSTSALVLAGPLLTIGSGMGISLAILDAAAVSSVEPERAGMAAGMFNTMRLSSEVVAIAAMGSLLVSLTQSRLADGIGAYTAQGAPDADTVANAIAAGDLQSATASVSGGAQQAFNAFAAGAYTDAFHVALWILAGVCAVAAPVIGWLLRERAPLTVADPSVEVTLVDA
ncbi:MFS transporter [Nocardioides sp.]|uniref:MFS transporter n=1 Tax=Nocardioides sp. TaxID=35761 RepID=UPI002CDF99AD|nr:MFS transporter [Nocardioides sp.]HXH79412.1 MFS transporter [Nocardioides sp.]